MFKIIDCFIYMNLNSLNRLIVLSTRICYQGFQLIQGCDYFYQPIQRTLCFQQKRFRTRINIQKPKVFFYYKAQVMKFLLPYYKHPNEGKNYVDVCENLSIEKKEKKLTPYEVVIAREVREKFFDAKVIAFLHRNGISMIDEFDFKVELHKCGMELKMYNNRIIKEVVRDTIFEPCLEVFKPNAMCVFGKEVNIVGFEKALKKFKQYTLLAGIMENRLLSHNEFLRFGSLDLTTARVGLVQVLQSAGGNNLNSQLTHHQRTLLSYLKQIGTKKADPDAKD